MTTGPTPVSPPLRFPRACRIKQGRDFARLKTQGRRQVCGCLILNWLSAGGSGQARFGVITSRKIGNAVVRNRARRLLREAWRQHQHGLTVAHELVLVARQSIAGMSFANVERDYLTALRRAGLLKAHEPGPAPHHV